MSLLSRKKNKKSETPQDGTLLMPFQSGNRGLEFLVEFVKRIRPDRPINIQEAELRFEAVQQLLVQDRSLLFSLRRSLLSQFLHTDIRPTLTESGIVKSRGFVQELIRKISHKILPELQKPTDFLFVLNRLFYSKRDFRWVEGINPGHWKIFFQLLGIQINLTEPALIRQLQESLQVLSFRVASAGLEKEITQRFEQFDSGVYSFIEQNRLVNIYIERFKGIGPGDERKLLLSNISETLHNCRQSIRLIREQRSDHGTSLAQTFLMFRMEQQIERMFIILDVLDADQHFNTDRFIQYFCTVIRNENRKNSIWEFLSNSLGLMAYQITEHKGKKGESYITSTTREYVKLFRSAMGGGVIISFITIFKNLLGKLPLAPFWQGVVYGTNYSFGFVLMDQTGTTLATKQPAYTASAVASSLDANKIGGKPDLRNLAMTVAKVSRSQIASFAGNLLVVFPLAYFLSAFYQLITGAKIAEGIAAEKLLEDQHPWHSLSLLYACFTGLFLFLSGVIAGYVENHMIYGKIPERLKTHPIFSLTMSKGRLDKMVNFVRKNSASLAGSISLGFFLGIAGPLGKIMGLPFDIRHITISAGNTGIGFHCLNHQVPLSYLITVIAGVLAIGFLNFFVSFSLAFFVAVKSRGIHLREYPEFLGILWRYFKKYPADFIRPPGRIRAGEDVGS